MTSKNFWGNPQELEIKRRIRVTVAAYAYEFEGDPIMSDAEFDKLALEIDLSVDTGNETMDKWFRENFEPCTGSWVHKHPDKQGLRRVMLLMRKNK